MFLVLKKETERASETLCVCYRGNWESKCWFCCNMTNVPLCTTTFQCCTSGHIAYPVHVAVANTFLMVGFHKMYWFSVITNVRVGSTKAVVTSAASLIRRTIHGVIASIEHNSAEAGNSSTVQEVLRLPSNRRLITKFTSASHWLLSWKTWFPSLL